jgi:hypothetical protein
MVVTVPTFPSLGPVVERTWMLPFAVVMETIAFIFIAVRLISRIHPTHAGGKVGIDDLFIGIGWVLQMASTVLIVQRKYCPLLIVLSQMYRDLMNCDFSVASPEHSLTR